MSVASAPFRAPSVPAQEAPPSREEYANGLILLAALACSAFNILPLIVLPLVAAAASFGLRARRAPAAELRRLFSGFRQWFAVFTAYSILLAAALGVDVWNPQLYRREFKFVVPFTFLLLFSRLSYPAGLERSIKRLLPWLAFASFAWLVAALVRPDFAPKSLYPVMGRMWEPAGSGMYVYLGPFISHTAAGGFYAVLTVLLLGLLRSEEKNTTLLSVLASAACLYFTGSRAYLLACSAVAGGLGLWVLSERARKASWRFWSAHSVVVALCLVGLFYAGVKVGDQDDTRVRNARVRIWLWHRALSDFEGSPLLGVGPSRFDDDPDVPLTIPDWQPPKGSRGSPRYLDIPFFRMNVGKLSFHTDQHAHNTYLNVLAEGGLVLAALLAAMFGTLTRDLYRSISSANTEDRDLKIGALCALACVAIASMFGNNLLGMIPMATLCPLAGYLLSDRPSS